MHQWRRPNVLARLVLKTGCLHAYIYTRSAANGGGGQQGAVWPLPTKLKYIYIWINQRNVILNQSKLRVYELLRTLLLEQMQLVKFNHSCILILCIYYARYEITHGYYRSALQKKIIANIQRDIVNVVDDV